MSFRALLLPACIGLLLAGSACSDKTLTPPGATCPGADHPGPALSDTTDYVVVAHDRAETWAAAAETPGGLHLLEGHGLLGQAPNDLEYREGILYALNSQSNQLQLIDPRTGVTLDCLDLGAGTGPWELVLDPHAPERGWITTFVSGELIEVDLQGPEVLRRETLGPGLEGLWVGPDRVAVTFTGFQGTEGSYAAGALEILDKTTLETVAMFSVPPNAQQVLAAPDGTLHVLCTGNYGQEDPPVWGQVVRTNTAWSAITDTLLLGGTPGKVLVLPSGHAVVAGWFGGLLAYDAGSFTLLNGTLNPLEGSNGYTDAVLGARGVYASNFDLDALLVLDPETLAPTGSLLTGDGPAALVAIPRSSVLD